MIYSNQISRALDDFHAYIARNLPACAQHPAARVSEFWSEHFADRCNFPDVRDFLSFRRGDFVYGIGDTGPASPKQKQQEFDDICKSISLFTPQGFLDGLHEPILGAPLVYSCGKASLSASYVLNAGTAWRIKQLLEQYGSARSPIHVCEIGAGWGACASQLHQVSDVASYTIVDLPENLCLSSTYLAATLPGRQAAFVECAPGASVIPQPASLNFALPPAIDKLSGPYDLIINTMSFQEMDRETVDEYFRWAVRALAPGGLLLSFNAHDKAGIVRPSEYMHHGLQLVHIAPFRKVPAGYFNTIPYETVFRRQDGRSQSVLAPAVDALGELVQLGLDSELESLAATTLSEHSATSLALLGLIREFFYAEDEERRQFILTQLLSEAAGQNIGISHFLAGNYWYTQGDMVMARRYLEESVAGGLSDFALVRAQVLLATITATPETNDATVLAMVSAGAGGLLNEIETIVLNNDISKLQNHIARVLDCPVAGPQSSTPMLKRVLRRLVGTGNMARNS
jgi:hypothetical protein